MTNVNLYFQKKKFKILTSSKKMGNFLPCQKPCQVNVVVVCKKCNCKNRSTVSIYCFFCTKVSNQLSECECGAENPIVCLFCKSTSIMEL